VLWRFCVSFNEFLLTAKVFVFETSNLISFKSLIVALFLARLFQFQSIPCRIKLWVKFVVHKQLNFSISSTFFRQLI